MIKIAVIGLGSMGKNHYRVLNEIDEVQIAALCDVEPKNVPVPFYTDMREMIKKHRPDAVIVAVPTYLHKKVALEAIELGCHLFIEKPAASSAQEAEEILNAAERAGLKSCVGHVERFNPAVAALKEELKNRTVYTIEITRVGPFPPRISDVGVLTDLAVHDIDLIRYITEKEILDRSVFKSRKIHNHHEDNAVLNFILENDVIASITTNWLTPFKKRKIEVACEKVYYEADLISQKVTEYSDYRTDNSYRTKELHIKKEEPLLMELLAFVDYLKSGNRGNLASIADSIETLKIAKGQ